MVMTIPTVRLEVLASMTLRGEYHVVLYVYVYVDKRKKKAPRINAFYSIRCNPET